MKILGGNRDQEEGSSSSKPVDTLMSSNLNNHSTVAVRPDVHTESKYVKKHKRPKRVNGIKMLQCS